MWFHVAVLQLVLESLDFIRLLGIKGSSEAPWDTTLTSAGRRTRMVCQEQVLRLFWERAVKTLLITVKPRQLHLTSP